MGLESPKFETKPAEPEKESRIKEIEKRVDGMRKMYDTGCRTFSKCVRPNPSRFKKLLNLFSS